MDLKMTFSQLPNHHCMLRAITTRNPTKGYNDALVNRSSDPGVGAFSYHLGRKIAVTRDVQAGEELFLDYGHCDGWEEGDPDWVKHVVSREDYKAASRVTRSIWNNLTDSLGTTSNDLSISEEQTKLFGT